MQKKTPNSSDDKEEFSLVKKNDSPNTISHIPDSAIQQPDERLLDFYNTDAFALTEEEQESLYPIHDSLQNNMDRYEELELIAVGAEKKITKVYDHQLNRQVAMARAVHATTRREQEQFLQEAHLEANLAHPNIIPIHNIGLDNDQKPYFTMELVPGDSLKNILKARNAGQADYKRNYPIEKLLEIYLKICNAIAYAHSRNVIHLDIKPDNIRVGSFGEVFVLDWGLASVMVNENNSGPVARGEIDGEMLNDITPPNLMKGSPGFMAPEQTEINRTKTSQTDIYALGALLYTILTGELPVEGASTTEMVENTRKGKLVPVHEHRTKGEIPKSLAAVAMKALALDPADRYHSVTELEEEIQRYMAGYPTSAEHASFNTQFVLLLRRHNRMTAMFMLFLLILAGVIGGTLMQVSQEKTIAVAARKTAEENLLLYIAQREKSERLSTDLIYSILQAATTDDYSQSSKMIPLLEIGLQHNLSPKTHEHLLAQKAIFHFVQQEFSKANDCLEKTAYKFHSSNNIRLLVREYAAVKPDDRKKLTIPQLTDLITKSKIYNQKKLDFYLYYHHMISNPEPDPTEYLGLAEIMLHRLNILGRKPPIRTLELKQRPKGLHLDLSGLPFTIYTLSTIDQPLMNVLEPLKLYSLDISNTAHKHLGELKGLRIKELTMTDMNIVNKKVLPGQIARTHIDRVYLNKKSYSSKIISLMENQFDVIDVINVQ